MSRKLVDSEDEDSGDAGGSDAQNETADRRMTNGHDQEQGQAADEADEEDEDFPQLRAKGAVRNLGKKRARSEYEDGSDLDGEGLQKDTLCSDGFHVGSIISIKLQNFMTYDYVDFAVGPNLNMVIGANGTGKSSIVSAIALGLAYKTNVLGRATEFKDYVKNGQTQGSISITLRKSKQLQNVTITRLISGTANKSSWQIDNVSTTQREVTDLVQSLNIQIDSLCSFLPQEKVVEFAKLTPPELLAQTQRAVGSKKMAEQHRSLQELKKSLIDESAKLRENQDELDRLEAHNETVGREVERYQDRQRIQKELAVLELTVLSAEYAEAKDAWTKHKVLYNHAREALRKLTVVEDPTKIKQKKALALINRYTSKMDELKIQIKRTEEKQRETEKLIQANSSKSEAKASALTALRAREKKKKERIAKMKEDIDTLEDELSTPVEPPDTEAWKAKLVSVGDAIVELAGRSDSLKDQRQEIAEAQKLSLLELQDKIRQIDALDDVRKRRLDMLRKFNPQVAETVDWLRAHRGRFRGRVHEPVCLEINVINPRYAAAVEAAINIGDMMTFVCEEDEDYREFSSIVIDQMHKRVNISGCRATDELPEGESQGQLRRLGFDGNILDFVDGPQAVLSFLRISANIHRFPVALGNVDPQVAADAQIQRYISGDSFFNVKYARYGRRLPQTLQRALRRPNLLSDTVDLRQKQNLERDRDVLQAKIEETEAKVGKINAQINKLRPEDTELREKRDRIKQQKLEAMKPYARYQKAQMHLKSLKANLETELNQPERFSEERATLKNTLEQGTRDGVELAAAFYKLTCQKADLLESQLQMLIEQHQIKSAHDQWAEDRKANDGNLVEAETRLRDLGAESTTMKEAAMDIYNRLREAQGRADAETIEAYEADPKTTPLAELQQHQTELQTQLELIVAPTSGVVRAFESRQVEIGNLKTSVAELEAKVSDQREQITEIHNEWFPALTALVERISTEFEAAFDRIGCAGAVHLAHDDEDYGKWGIDILVKFRDHDALQSLTGQRQSGGERSVSTILYLMSLQELAKAPFRVVDEINQGMDPKNERLVHSQMVEKACKAGTSQYFLITPKLLPDLKYHERMTVLCVYNGDWLPENAVSFTKLLSAKRASISERKAKLNGAHISPGVAVH